MVFSSFLHTSFLFYAFSSKTLCFEFLVDAKWESKGNKITPFITAGYLSNKWDSIVMELLWRKY